MVRNINTFAINLTLESFCLIMSVMLTLFCIFFKRKREKRSVLIIHMCIINCVALLLDILVVYHLGKPEYNLLLSVLTTLNFILGFALNGFIAVYITTIIKDDRGGKSKIFSFVQSIQALVAWIAVLFNFWFGFLFYYEDGVYVRGKYFWIILFWALAMILDDGIYILYMHSLLTRREILTFLSLGVFPIAAFVLQYIFPGLKLIFVAALLCFIIFFMEIHVQQAAVLQEKERQLEKMNLSIIVSQLQPHFLYNALTNISLSPGNMY